MNGEKPRPFKRIYQTNDGTWRVRCLCCGHPKHGLVLPKAMSRIAALGTWDEHKHDPEHKRAERRRAENMATESSVDRLVDIVLHVHRHVTHNDGYVLEESQFDSGRT